MTTRCSWFNCPECEREVFATKDKLCTACNAKKYRRRKKRRAKELLFRLVNGGGA